MILFFIFMPLCIIFNGDYNCDYEWTFIADKEIFDLEYIKDGRSYPENGTVLSFGSTSQKKIYFHSSEMYVILHEIEHIKCDLGKSSDRDNCHIQLDVVVNIRNSYGEFD